ncbi:MAG: hypothetical protein ACXW07_06215, partial [Nitrososphaeraceae archaeon]
ALAVKKHEEESELNIVIADNASQEHNFSNLSIIRNKRKPNKYTTVTTIAGSKRIDTIGDVVISDQITLSNVNYISGGQFNLLSLPKAADQKLWTILSPEEGFIITAEAGERLKFDMKDIYLNLKRFKNGMWGTIIQPKYLPEPKPDNNNLNNPSITKINQTVPLADYQEQIRRLKIEERKLKEKQEMDKMIDNFDRKLQNGDIELPQEIENNAITKATINELNEHRKQNAGRIPKYKNATENKESSKHQMTIKTRNGNNSQNSRSQSQTHVTYQDEDSEQEMYFSDEDLGTDNNSNSYSHFTLSTYENTCALVTNESQEPETQIEIVKVDQEDLNKAITLHNKFAHPGINTMIELNKEYKLGITDKVLKALKQTKCETCLTTKAKRKSIRHKNTEPNRKSLEVLDTFCCDLIGPLSSTEEGDKLALPSINGEYYILIVVDQFSNILWLEE